MILTARQGQKFGEKSRCWEIQNHFDGEDVCQLAKGRNDMAMTRGFIQ